MNAGHVADLVQEILEDKANMFLDWPAFESWFLSKFMYSNEVQHAALMLEGTSYHQQDHTLDVYINGFKQLVCCLGFPRSMQLVLCFQCRPDPSIYKWIDGIVDGCPEDEDIEDWIMTAYLVDWNTHAD